MWLSLWVACQLAYCLSQEVRQYATAHVTQCSAAAAAARSLPAAEQGRCTKRC